MAVPRSSSDDHPHSCAVCGGAALTLFAAPVAHGGVWTTTTVGECVSCASITTWPIADGTDGRGLPGRWRAVLGEPPSAIFASAGDRAEAVSVGVPLAQGPVWHEFRDNWWAVSPGQHLWVPTLDGLRRLAAGHGFVIDSVTPGAPVDHYIFSELIARRVPPAHASAALISEREQRAMRRKARRCRTESKCPEAIVCFRRVAS